MIGLLDYRVVNIFVNRSSLLNDCAAAYITLPCVGVGRRDARLQVTPQHVAAPTASAADAAVILHRVSAPG